MPGCAVEVQAADAKGVKDALKHGGVLDLCRRTASDETTVTLPLLPCDRAALPATVRAALDSGVARLVQVSLAPRARVSTPAGALRTAVAALGAPPELLADLPTRWERLGDLALLPGAAMQDARWLLLYQPEELWAVVAAALGVCRLARQAAVDPGPRRSSRAVLLHPPGASGWTTVLENGVSYSLDVTQSMFSSGNGTEKQRMAALPAAGETVVDLFCGIGYWTLPLLLHARVAHVYACEVNPPSLEALRRNLALNGVAASCTVLPGDCRLHAPTSCAHRVLLGLLPSAQVGFPAAVAALLDQGGTCHVHGNAAAGSTAHWGQETALQLQAIARAMAGREAWTASLLHVETVKSYAPRILHCVADVRLGPPASAALASEALVVLDNPSCEEMLARAVHPGRPAHLLGLDLGEAPSLWSDARYLQCHADSDVVVTAHESDEAALEWHPRKNFTLRNCSLGELVRRASGAASEDGRAPPHIYLRAVGRDARREPACLATSFPHLAQEVQLPACALPPPGRAVHSSVLRVASPGLSLWLHYDCCDNVLLQLAGSKTVTLFAPSAAGDLYLRGSSSQVPTRALDAPQLAQAQHPRYAAARARAAATQVTLLPGQGLYIPRYWAHAVTAGAQGISVGVNVFWRAPAHEPQPAPSADVYANQDPEKAIAALAAAQQAQQALAALSEDARRFYRARVLATLTYDDMSYD